MNTACTFRRASWGRFALLITALLGLQAAACFRSLDVSKLKCQTKSDCPDGFTCSANRCVQGAANDDAVSVGDTGPTNPGGGSDVAIVGDTGRDTPLSTEVGSPVDVGAPIDADSDTSGTAPQSLSNGVSCKADTQCTSGNCVDGVCCDGRCEGNCESCTTGKCSASTAPRKPCDGTGTCGGYCDKANTKTCTYPNSSITCSAQKCEAGQRTSKAVCDGKGGCPTPSTSKCDTNQCNADKTDCSGSCTATSCGTGTYCAGTTCAPVKNQGDACGSDIECSTKKCVDGYCCESACSGNCQSCSVVHGKCTTTTVPRASCGGSGNCAGYCDGSKADCSFPGASTVCEAAKCLNTTTSQAARSCDGKGACSSGASSSCQYMCTSAGICGGECSPSNLRCNSLTGIRQQCSAAGSWQDNGCPATQACSGSGSCVCATGYSTCGGTGTCYNTSSDDNHCGASCKNCTTTGQACQSGQCQCALGMAACNGCLGWDFESGTQGWVSDTHSGYPVTSVASVTDSAYTGSHSLMVNGASVMVPLCSTGATINLANRTLSLSLLFTGDTDYPWNAAVLADAWGPTDSNGCSLIWGMKRSEWYNVSCQFPDGASLQADHISIRMPTTPLGPWFIDHVSIN